MRQKIFTALVIERKQKTADQFAAQLGTTTKTVAARISEIRDSGYVIKTARRVDTKGRVKYFYRHSNPNRLMVQAGRAMMKAFGMVGQRLMRGPLGPLLDLLQRN
jgi:predicted transcriptional regulator